MMICSDVQARLSLVADGDLPEAERPPVDAHLKTCAACRGVLQDLERLRRAAASLHPIAPPDHVWLQVAGQVRLDRPEAPHTAARVDRRSAVSQWIGLAAALVVVTVSAFYFSRQTPGVDPESNPPPTTSVETIAEELNLAMKHYESAITQLESLAKADPGALDPVMAESLQQNIRTINVAIDESRTALLQNPGSEPARESLFEALRRKVVVLQATVNLMNEMRKGNQTGALQAAGGFTKGS